MSNCAGADYTPFERALLAAILEVPTSAAAVLRDQIAKSRPIARRYTGVGSYTDIEVERTAPTALGVASTPAEQRDVAIWRHGISIAAGCVLFVDEEGYVSCIEVYTVGDDVWNDDPNQWIIVPTDGGVTHNPFATTPS